MLGTRRKEIDYQAVAFEAVASLSPDTIAALPRILQIRLEQLEELRFEGEIRGIEKLAKVLKADFKPYTPPEDYYIAEMQKKWRVRFEKSPIGDLKYNLMLPKGMIGRFSIALDTNLFERFVVASPVWRNFCAQRGNAAEPLVLVGYIPNNANRLVSFRYTTGQSDRTQREGTPGAVVENGTGFLIA